MQNVVVNNGVVVPQNTSIVKSMKQQKGPEIFAPL